MPEPSRMLARVRRRGLPEGARIPRKGRIRVVLALLGGIVVLRTVWLHPKTASTPKPRVTRPAEAVGQTKLSPTPKMQRPVAAPKQSRPFFAWPFFSPKETLHLADPQLDDVLRGAIPSLRAAIDTIRNNGRILAVHTSLDPLLQEHAQRLMRRYAPRYGAAVAMEPATGRILCLVSFTGDSQPVLDDRLYCRSIFPAASIFKTVTAAAAMEKGGLGPESALRHAGRNHTLYKFQLAENLQSYRDITLTEAYAYSVNPVFGRIGLYLIGCDALREYARRFGFAAQVPFLFPVDTALIAPCDSSYALAELASGFNRATTLSPVLGAMIASAIAERGVMMLPLLIDSVVNLASLHTAFRANPAEWATALRPATVSNLRRMMAKVAQYGTARESFRYLRNSFRFRDLQFGGKTGSLDKDGLGRIDWFIGFIRSDANSRQRLAASVVTVHGANWTVHSSFIAAELMRVYIREMQRAGGDADAASRRRAGAAPANLRPDSSAQEYGG